MLRKSVIRFALLASLSLTGANATNITYSGDDPYRSFDIWMNADGVNANVIAGIAILQVDGFTTVDVVCVDFFVGIGDGIYSVNLLGPNAISNGTRVAWMLRNTLPSINTQSDPLARRRMAAGFQLAIWDIVHDSGDGLSAGRIRQSTSTPTDSTVLFWANAFLGGTVGQSLNSGIVYRNVGGIGVSQQLMSDVAEPSTYAMFLTGGVLVGLQQRLKRK